MIFKNSGDEVTLCFSPVKSGQNSGDFKTISIKKIHFLRIISANYKIVWKILRISSLCLPELYCKPINIGGYLIWRFLPSGHIGYYLNWLSLVVCSTKLMKALCIGGYLIWQLLGPSQIRQFKSPPNINRFTVTTVTK